MINLSNILDSKPSKQLSIPTKNMNFSLVGDELYFQIGNIHSSSSPLLKLTPNEIQLYNNIDGIRHLIEYEFLSYIDISSKYSTLIKWEEIGIIELPTLKSNHKKVVVFEPHMDDAALSVGGTILSQNNEKDFSIISMVGRSNYTSYPNKSANHTHQVSKIRRNESILACKLLNADYFCLEELDQPLRWALNNQPDLLPYEEINRISKKLFRIICSINPCEIWIPLALDFHADHHTARNAALLMISENLQYFQNKKIIIYEDQPYSVNFPEKLKERMLQQIGLGTKPKLLRNKITNKHKEKLRINSIFSSQFKIDTMKDTLILAAEKEESRDLYEDQWQLSLPIGPLEPEFWEDNYKTSIIYNLIKKSDEINIIKFDFFIDYDFELFIEIFPHVKVNLYLPKKEEVRSRSFSAKSVEKIYVHNNFYEMVKLCDHLNKKSDKPTFIFAFELVWDNYRSYLSQHSKKDLAYVSFWFSSFITALNKYYLKINPNYKITN